MFDEVFIEKKAPNTQQDPNNPDDSLCTINNIQKNNHQIKNLRMRQRSKDK